MHLTGSPSPAADAAGAICSAPAVDSATAVFIEYRDLLFSIVYNVLGTVTDTEDVMQETWLSWAAADRSTVASPRSYLVRIAVNEALSRLRRARRNRESYVGPWLPEPLVTQENVAEGVVQAESVSLALMVVLESLTPLERAVFVLREAFGYEHDEIAAVLKRSSAAVRQLAHRAREHVKARCLRYAPDPEACRAVTEAFLAAATGGDLAALMEILAPDVTMWSDGGGKVRHALRVVAGRTKVARLVCAVAAEVSVPLTVRYLNVNGGPAALLFADGKLYAMLAVDLNPESDLIRGIYGLINPDKLSGLAEVVRTNSRSDPEGADDCCGLPPASPAQLARTHPTSPTGHSRPRCIATTRGLARTTDLS